ncbi:hypothetical protein PoB_007353500 [Plakobranchus ocellatus]|uniref:Uncharacterized protein n=1 Tax=Plakobranchus ocellatus TaxID=259542 RepID=A0AAV4DSR1_9GAST|nr:hypothetical protein PoB_007353500 [Plakobranchus ocellatus]
MSHRDAAHLHREDRKEKKDEKKRKGIKPLGVNALCGIEQCYCFAFVRLLAQSERVALGLVPLIITHWIANSLRDLQRPHLSRVRASPLAPLPYGGTESLRSSCCGLAVNKNPIIPLEALAVKWLSHSPLDLEDY